MIWNAPAAYLFGLGGVGLSLYAMARAEEDFLQRKFGADYVAYCQRVNRFLPRLRGLRQTIARFDFDWKRVVRKEYGPTFSCGTIAIVLIVMEHVEWKGSGAQARRSRQGRSAGWLWQGSGAWRAG